MNKHLYPAAFALGALAVLWVGAGFAATNLPALAMTALIGAVYGGGALEILRFRRATASLTAALATVPAGLARLDDWLGGVHPALRIPVRQRIEGERGGLPGPALAPYLAGLLVMLGMLGTFVGMVAAFNGAVFALDGAADLAAIRAALAAPVKGLGLAFGTSVAGVAASAMLGLMSALARRERMQAAQLLDGRIAVTALGGFSLAHQRRQAYQALPRLLDRMEAMMARMECRYEETNARLLAGQEGFHAEIRDVHGELARAVDRSLRESLTQSAQAAGASLRPVVEAALAEVTRDARTMAGDVGRALERTAREMAAQTRASAGETQAEIGRLMAAAAEAPRAAAAAIDELRREMSRSVARDDALLAERGRILEALDALLAAVGHAAAEQRASIEALTAAAATTLDAAGGRFAEQVGAETARLSEVAAHVGGGAIEVASLGEAFGLAVRAFGETGEKLVANLQGIEAALERSMARSDDQLAYYVAQAREVIDLSLLSQKEVCEALRRAPAAAGAN